MAEHALRRSPGAIRAFATAFAAAFATWRERFRAPSPPTPACRRVGRGCAQVGSFDRLVQNGKTDDRSTPHPCHSVRRRRHPALAGVARTNAEAFRAAD